jgi:hypothetical protein
VRTVISEHRAAPATKLVANSLHRRELVILNISADQATRRSELALNAICTLTQRSRPLEESALNDLSKETPIMRYARWNS